MPYELSWQMNQRAVKIDIFGVLTRNEIFTLVYQLRDEILSPVTHSVSVIIDLEKMESYPQDLKTLTEATKVYIDHPNVGWVIVLGINNPVAKFLANVVFQIVGTKYKTASSLEEAFKLVEKVDTNLQD